MTTTDDQAARVAPRSLGTAPLGSTAASNPLHPTSGENGRTPGEWWTRQSQTRFDDGRFDVAIIVSVPLPNGGSTNAIIAECFGRVDTNVYVNAAANASLIAAAPDLLAALKAIVDIPQIDGVGMRFTFDYNSPLGQQARAAIAKAEGR